MWFAMYGGKGNAQFEGGIAGLQVGHRKNGRTLALDGNSIMDFGSSTQFVAAGSILYGHEVAFGPELRAEWLVGPSVIDHHSEGMGMGVQLGAHLSWPFGKVIGLGASLFLNVNNRQTYSGMVVQLEFGRLR